MDNEDFVCILKKPLWLICRKQNKPKPDNEKKSLK